MSLLNSTKKSDFSASFGGCKAIPVQGLAYVSLLATLVGFMQKNWKNTDRVCVCVSCPHTQREKERGNSQVIIKNEWVQLKTNFYGGLL